MRAASCCGSLIGTKNQRIKPTTMSCTECQMPIYAVNAQNVTTAFRQVAPELDIVDICMNGSELGASIFHERMEQLTHEQPQLRFGLQLGSHAIHVAHDEVDDEVADLAALPNVKLGLTNAGTTYSEVAAFAHLPLDFARLLYLVKCSKKI